MEDITQPDTSSTPGAHSIGSQEATTAPLAWASTQASQQSTTHNRSCNTCKERKVKCDKTFPCSACCKSNRRCRYDNAENISSHRAKSQYRELRKRLAELEATVEKIKPRGPESGDQDVCDQFGELIIDDQGKSRYFNGSFWTSLSSEVQSLQLALDNDVDSSDNLSSKSSAPDLSNGMLFSFSSFAVDLRRQHPPPSIMDQLWNIFIHNFDPMVKVVHKPTMSVLILSAIADISHVTKDLEAVMFAIYYAALITLEPKDIRNLFQTEPSRVISQYRFLAEQALAQAEVIQSQDILTFEAFLIYLNCQLCFRKHDDTRSVWRLTGLAVRIAQALGLHRDGAKFGLRPFDIEMRRRLWWQVLILDIRAADDHGCDPTIIHDTYDTKLPSNCDDEEISPESTEIPLSRDGHTDMTFNLLRCEMNILICRMMRVGAEDEKMSKQSRLKIQVEIFESWNKKLQEKYVRPFHSNMKPIEVVTITLCKLIMAKLWIVIYHPLHVGSDRDTLLSEKTRDALFVTSLKYLQHCLKIEEDTVTSKFNWFYKGYFPWHAVMYVLTEMCYSNRKLPDVERAWMLLNKFVNQRPPEAQLTLDSKVHVWQLLEHLMAKVSTKCELSTGQDVGPPKVQQPPLNPINPMPEVQSDINVPQSEAEWNQLHRTLSIEEQARYLSSSNLSILLDNIAPIERPQWGNFDNIWQEFSGGANGDDDPIGLRFDNFM
ncbi:fungal-specific transcription factor domain-containing protein [Xylogone sp. PMI_703]|nr:fungal-specific transcription factor domain-containing protein [Xylogone sp. PMI_703]